MPGSRCPRGLTNVVYQLLCSIHHPGPSSKPRIKTYGRARCAEINMDGAKCARSVATQDVRRCICNVSQALLRTHLSTCRVTKTSQRVYSTQKNSLTISHTYAGSVRSANGLTLAPPRNVASSRWRSKQDDLNVATINCISSRSLLSFSDDVERRLRTIAILSSFSNENSGTKNSHITPPTSQGFVCGNHLAHTRSWRSCLGW